MPNAIKWEQPWVNRGIVLGTQLNALGVNARSVAGAEIDNSANLDQYGILELVVDYATAPSAGGRLDIYMVTAPNGTNYEDGSDTVDPGLHKIVASLPVRNDANPQRLICRPFALEPAKTKFILLNKTDQPFPATGTTLTLYTDNDEVQ